MSDLKTALERIAEVGVEGIALIPLREPEARRRTRSRRIIAVVAAAGIVVAAMAVAAVVRSPNGRRPTTRGSSGLVADSSYEEPSESMSPTVQVGDVVSLATNPSVIERGDVVRFRIPVDPTSAVTTPLAGDGTGLKRVIGLPGESIEGHGGDVFVNGRKLAEPYADHITMDFAPVSVPQGFYFVLGDNRPNSKDSRHFGPIPRSEILAIALRITAPADHAGPITGSPRR